MLFASARGQLAATVVVALGVAACSDDLDPSTEPSAPTTRPPPTVDQDPTLDALELSSTRVQVQTLGKPDGDVIIVLHGGPGTTTATCCRSRGGRTA